MSGPAACDSSTIVPAASAARRWWILRQQIEQHHEPCFSTEARYTCAETRCEFREECLCMRAEWRR